jgi:hypothetical protein
VSIPIVVVAPEKQRFVYPIIELVYGLLGIFSGDDTVTPRVFISFRQLD